MKIILLVWISIFLSFCTGTDTTTEGDGIRLLMLSRAQATAKTEETAPVNETVKPKVAVSSVLKGSDSKPISGAKLTYNASGLSSKVIEPRSSDLVTVTTSSTGRYSLTLTTGSFRVDVKSATDESLGSLTFEVKSVDEVPTGKAEEGGKLSNPEVTAKKAPSVSLPSPTSISFTDTATVKGKVAGLMTLKPASDEAAITFYLLYWADELGYKLTEVARFSQTGSDITYNLSEVDVPTGASKFLLVSANAEGEMDTGASLVFEDK